LRLSLVAAVLTRLSSELGATLYACGDSIHCGIANTGLNLNGRGKYEAYSGAIVNLWCGANFSRRIARERLVII
jgi:hypothetical protein